MHETDQPESRLSSSYGRLRSCGVRTDSSYCPHVQYCIWCYNGERLKMTKIRNNPTILSAETKYNGSGETIHTLQNCKNKEEYEILCEEQRKNVLFSLFLGFCFSWF
jgi:hypothetical protein